MKRISEYILAVVLVFAGVIFVTALYSYFVDGSGRALPLPTTPDSIGLLEINGVILRSEPVVEQIARFKENRRIKAILVRINSPGGGVAASQEIYEALKSAREEGYVILASMSSVAASGGYYVACAADTIVANPGTTTGSIGVIMSLLDYSELLKKLGIKYNAIKSGKFKDVGSASHPMTAAERAHLQRYIDDAYGQFIDVVAEARKLDRDRVLQIADGRIYTGQQAQQVGLVDVLGTYDDAVELTAAMAGIPGKPRIVKSRRRRRTLFDVIFGDAQEYLQTLQSLPVLRYQLVF